MLVYLVQIQRDDDVQYLFSRNIALYNECYGRHFSAKKYALRYFANSSFCAYPHDIISVDSNKDYALGWEVTADCI